MEEGKMYIALELGYAGVKKRIMFQKLLNTN